MTCVIRRIIGETLDEVCPCLRADIDHPFEDAEQWQPAYAVLGVHDRTKVPKSAQGVVTVFESTVALVKLIPDVTLQERVVNRNQIRMLVSEIATNNHPNLLREHADNAPPQPFCAPSRRLAHCSVYAEMRSVLMVRRAFNRLTTERR